MTESRIPISVIIMTKNEERVLATTLASVAAFDQVFVVDSHSTDDTVKIAETFGAEVAQFTWDGQYPKKKEWALLNLPFRHDWVLYLDADETVTPALTAELARGTWAAEQHAAFDVDLDYFFLGKQLRHGHRVSKRVLVDRTQTVWPHVDDLGVASMWEVEGHYQPKIHGTVGKLEGRLSHNDIDPLFDYFARHNRYSDWEAHLALNPTVSAQVRESRSAKGRKYADLPFKPLVFFLYSYVLRRGFLDGKPGFHYAVFHSFYFWQTGLKQEELRRSAS